MTFDGFVDVDALTFMAPVGATFPMYLKTGHAALDDH